MKRDARQYLKYISKPETLRLNIFDILASAFCLILFLFKAVCFIFYLFTLFIYMNLFMQDSRNIG